MNWQIIVFSLLGVVLLILVMRQTLLSIGSWALKKIFRDFLDS